MTTAQPHRRRARQVVRLLLGAVLAFALAGCGGADPAASPGRGTGTSVDGASSAPGTPRPPYAISSEVISRPSLHDIRVWAPVRGKGWPVVYAVPGSGGRKANFDQVGPALARQGVAVFATDYSADSSDEELTRDLECGYRYTRKVAGQFGGDLRQPVAVVGYSRGARAVWSLLDESRFGPRGSFHDCFSGAPLPDVVAAVEGCYYAFAGWTHPFPIRRFDLGDAKVVLVSGEADDTCPTWQSRKAAHALAAADHDTTLVTIASANHYSVVFHDVVGGRHVSVPEDPAGQRTVRAILDAIRAAR